MSEPRPGNSAMRGICRRLVRGWLALLSRKVRVLRAGGVNEQSAALLAVSHPASFWDALILATAFDRPTYCLAPREMVEGPLARFLARGLGMILCEDSENPGGEWVHAAIRVLAGGGSLVVFADQTPASQTTAGAFASRLAFLVGNAESQLAGRQVAIHPVHLFLPAPSSPSRELLIYIDSALARPAAGQAADSALSVAAQLQASFQANAFRLAPADLEYFLADLEEVLRAGLEQDWSARPNWKQDTEGFVLSRFVADWVRQTNTLNPGRLVTLRQSLESYRRLEQQLALDKLKVEAASSWMQSGLRRAVVWLETIIGLPLALYGLVNHLVIGAVLFLSGSFKKKNVSTPTTVWIIRGAVVLAGYAVQVFFVAHRWGRAAGGYYAPTLPVTGLYLWRYLWLLEYQTRPLVTSFRSPASTLKAHRLRQAFLEELDKVLTDYEAGASVPR